MFYVYFNQNYICIDSSKARSVEHHKMTQKKARIDKIIDRLNEKGVIVTQQHLDSGVFPWHKIGSGRGKFFLTVIRILFSSCLSFHLQFL